MSAKTDARSFVLACKAKSFPPAFKTRAEVWPGRSDNPVIDIWLMALLTLKTIVKEIGCLLTAPKILRYRCPISAQTYSTGSSGLTARQFRAVFDERTR